MNTNSVPTFFIKPHVLFVDDDSYFLDSVAEIFCDVFHVETLIHPEEVRDRLMRCSDLQQKIKQHIVLNSDTSGTLCSVDFSYKDLALSLLKQCSVHDYPSVVCIDYGMPTMNGLDVCRLIRDVPVARVLLTAGLETDELIAAFEDGLVHKYIRKSDTLMMEKIEDVARVQHNRFVEDFNHAYLNIFADNGSYKKLFNEPEFVSYFETLVAHKDIEFSCVYEPGGSLLARTQKGDMCIVNIYSQDEIHHVVYESRSFECMSEKDQNSIRDHMCIVDYKTILNNNRLNEKLEIYMSSVFTCIPLNDEIYYIVCRDLDKDERLYVQKH